MHTPPVVLIADDEEPIAEAVAYVVEDAGYQPVVAAHGREALALARERKPDLVITDIMMPLMNGLELIVNLRQDAIADGTLPPNIIVMTAAGDRQAREAQADAILRKPFDLITLENLLHRFLDNRG